MKQMVKKTLVRMGLAHPAMGVKISGERKVEKILEARRPDQHIFVETGTNTGTTLASVRNSFKKLYSIELDSDLYARAQEKFAGDTNVMLVYGDSARQLPPIVAVLTEPTLFWLDAHAGGAITTANSPIVAELESIFNHPIKTHTILIDDARKFDRASIWAIKNLSKKHGYTMHIAEGLFFIEPVK